MNLYEYWKSLSDAERVTFCKKAGVAYGYMESHLIHARKYPHMKTIQAIVEASNQTLTHEGLFGFFLKDSQEQTA